MEEVVLSAEAIDDPFAEQVEGLQNQTTDPPVVEDTEPKGDSILEDFLSANGIDSSKIKFEDESGNVVERSWNELSKEEKLSILFTPSLTPVDQYSTEEMDLISKIREAQLTPEQYLESLKEQTTAPMPQAPVYEIDGISDDELFVLDALDKYGEENVSDEQLEELLKNAKADPDLYQKAIENLRATYKHREDEYRYREQQELEAQREQEFNEFSNTVLKEIQSLDMLGGQNIELSVDDMNDIANYILSRDDAGNSEFSRTMNDPKKFVELAFWALKGNDIMSEISSQLKAAYEKGVEAGKKGQSQLTFGNSSTDTNPARTSKHMSASALDVE